VPKNAEAQKSHKIEVKAA